MPKNEYKIKDVDNVAKSVLDAFKGIVYEDDKNIKSLFVNKVESETRDLFIGFKIIEDNDKGWYVPPLLHATK